MNKTDYATEIRSRVEKANGGALFVMVDMADVAPNNAANRVMTRLVKEGVLRAIVRGVYQKPSFNRFLGELEDPSADDLARALARKNGWAIRPDGDTALNLLGLSTQVPSNWSYVSDGPYKTYAYGNGKIIFKHTANRLIGRLSWESALFVQALRALGEANVDCAIRKGLAARFSTDQLVKIESETRATPDWIHALAVSLKEQSYA